MFSRRQTSPKLCGSGTMKKASSEVVPTFGNTNTSYGDPPLLLPASAAIRPRFITRSMFITLSAVLVLCLKYVVLYDCIIIKLKLSNGLSSRNLRLPNRLIYSIMWSIPWKLRFIRPFFKSLRTCPLTPASILGRNLPQLLQLQVFPYEPSLHHLPCSVFCVHFVNCC